MSKISTKTALWIISFIFSFPFLLLGNVIVGIVCLNLRCSGRGINGPGEGFAMVYIWFYLLIILMAILAFPLSSLLLKVIENRQNLTIQKIILSREMFVFLLTWTIEIAIFTWFFLFYKP